MVGLGVSSKPPESGRQGDLWSPEVVERLKRVPKGQGARGNGAGNAETGGGAKPVGARDQPLSVTQAVRRAMNALEALGAFWIEGEVTSLSRAASGHLYFGLRDDRTQLRAVMWRSDVQRLAFSPEDGMRLRCRGRPGIYDRDGTFQFYVQAAEPAGVGSDALALAALRKKLAAEGLFSAERKRILPTLPRRIGVVTSKTGAAIRDIIRAVQRRFPVPLLVVDTVVQGSCAPTQIVAALRSIARTDVDVVIVGRGGGSAGDLSAFNAEEVVREVAGFPIPIISAVGHEVDVSLTDLAADCRAATPTMAGEMAVPVLVDLASNLEKQNRRLHREIGFYLRQSRHDLERVRGRLEDQLKDTLVRRRSLIQQWQHRLQMQHPQTRLISDRAKLTAAVTRLDSNIRSRLANSGNRLAVLGSRLDALSPLRVLNRGYAVATQNRRVISRADSLTIGDSLLLRLSSGSVDCTVQKIHTHDEKSSDET